MTLNSGLLWKILLDKYPDAVDVQAVERKVVIETTVDAPQDYPWDEDTPRHGSVHTFGEQHPMLSESTIQLTEIEPETGIYTAMSAKTHRVYVYVDIQEHGII